MSLSTLEEYELKECMVEDYESANQLGFNIFIEIQ
jgi:hypothetical protein